MAKAISFGPTNTPVEGVSAITVPVAPIGNVDLLPLVDDPGVNIYTDITSPTDQPSTLRLATRDVANVYASSQIDPAAFLSSRKGRDIVVQAQEVHAVTDSADPSYLRLYPMKCTLTFNVPTSAEVTPAAVERMLARTLAVIARQGDDDLAAGISALLRGVTVR